MFRSLGPPRWRTGRLASLGCYVNTVIQNGVIVKCRTRSPWTQISFCLSGPEVARTLRPAHCGRGQGVALWEKIGHGSPDCCWFAGRFKTASLLKGWSILKNLTKVDIRIHCVCLNTLCPLVNSGLKASQSINRYNLNGERNEHSHIRRRKGKSNKVQLFQKQNRVPSSSLASTSLFQGASLASIESHAHFLIEFPDSLSRAGKTPQTIRLLRGLLTLWLNAGLPNLEGGTQDKLAAAIRARNRVFRQYQKEHQIPSNHTNLQPSLIFHPANVAKVGDLKSCGNADSVTIRLLTLMKLLSHPKHGNSELRHLARKSPLYRQLKSLVSLWLSQGQPKNIFWMETLVPYNRIAAGHS